MDFISKLEWENLKNSLEIEVSSICELLPSGTEKIKIFRSDTYQIKATIFGRASDSNELENWMNQWICIEGTNFIKPLDFRVSDQIFTYNLSGCLLDQTQSFSRWNRDRISQEFLEFEAHISVSSFCQKNLQENNETEVRLTDWYLNAPEQEFYSQLTKRSSKIIYEVDRDAKCSTYTFDQRADYGWNSIFIDLEDIKFLIHAVPCEFTPTWSRCLGIEYRNEWGEIPDLEKRKSISELVSFVAGRQILNVGFTKFDEFGYSLEGFSRNPPYDLGDNLRNTCQNLDTPPVRLREFDIQQERFFVNTEEVIKKLISDYLLLRGPLHLNEIFRRFWLFKELPIGDNLPILAAGVETLVEYYLSYKEIDIFQVYMPKCEFRELLKDELKSIRSKLRGKDSADRIESIILGAYNTRMGVNARIERFFGEIQLPIGAVEKTAMKARNTMTHSSIDMSDELQQYENCHITTAYETLFHRIILKLLDFDGSYIDYYSNDHVQRSIDEPVGG
jgi:hypothetical protein